MFNYVEWLNENDMNVDGEYYTYDERLEDLMIIWLTSMRKETLTSNCILQMKMILIS